MKSAQILSIQVGRAQRLGSEDASAADQRAWTSAIFKDPVSGPVWVGKPQISGDEQADLRVHGGPDKAVNLYPAEHLHSWATELGLEAMPGGSFGENLTTAGLLEADVCIGDIFRAGQVVLQVSQPRGPCWKLARRWGVPDLAIRADQTGRTGWYFRVLQEDNLQAGYRLELAERPNPSWSVQRAYFVVRAPALSPEDALALAALPELAAASQAGLLRGLEIGKRGPRRSALTGEESD